MNTKQWKSLLDKAATMVKNGGNWRGVLVDGNINSLGYVILGMKWSSDNKLTVSLISFLTGHVLVEKNFDDRLHKAAKWLTGSKEFAGIEIKYGTMRNND